MFSCFGFRLKWLMESRGSFQRATNWNRCYICRVPSDQIVVASRRRQFACFFLFVLVANCWFSFRVLAQCCRMWIKNDRPLNVLSFTSCTWLDFNEIISRTCNRIASCLGQLAMHKEVLGQQTSLYYKFKTVFSKKNSTANVSVSRFWGHLCKTGNLQTFYRAQMLGKFNEEMNYLITPINMLGCAYSMLVQITSRSHRKRAKVFERRRWQSEVANSIGLLSSLADTGKGKGDGTRGNGAIKYALMQHTSD